MNPIALRISRRTSHFETARAERPPLRLRVWVWLYCLRLDRELASGRAAESSEKHALRATQLAGLAARHRLACFLRRVVDDARKPRVPLHGARVPLHSEGVIEWSEALLGLAERLERPAPMSAIAVARVSVLLRDGTGPLYSRRSQRSLDEALWWIADGMRESCPPHDWDCPVIVKLDPGRVAWTCARCGAIVLNDDLAARPV